MPHKGFIGDRVVFPAIWLNSVVIFLLAYGGLCDNLWLRGLDYFFILFFAVEIVAKMVHEGRNKFWRNGWNIFDLIIIALSVPTLLDLFFPVHYPSYLLIFRLARSLKLFLFLQFIPNVGNIIRGTFRAFRSAFFVITGIGIYILILSILSTHLFRELTPQYFGNPLMSAFTHFQIITIEGWNEIPRAVAAASPAWEGWAHLYFAVTVLAGGMFGFSIVNAIFVDAFVHDNTRDLEQDIEALKQQNAEISRKLDLLLQAQENTQPPDS